MDKGFIKMLFAVLLTGMLAYIGLYFLIFS